MAVRAWLDRTADTWVPPTPGDLATPYRLLFWLTRQQARRTATGAILGTLWTVGLAVPPWVLSRVVDDGLIPRDTGALIGWTSLLLAVGIGNALLGIARHRTMTKVRMDASFRTVRATVRHASRLGASLQRHVTAGEVVTVGISDVYVVAQALTVTGPGVGAVIAYVVIAVVLFTISPLLAVVVLAGVPLLAVAVGPLLRRIERTGSEYRVHQGRLTTGLVDALAGLRVLNGLGGKTFVAERYDDQSQRLVRRGYRVAGPASWVGALSTGLPALFLAAVVWLSARLAATNDITIGDVVAVYGYVAVLVVPVAFFIEGAGDIARARVAGQRIIDLLNVPVSEDEERPMVAEHHGLAAVAAQSGPLTDSESNTTIHPGRMTALISARPAETRAVVERLGQIQRNRSTTWDGVPIADLPRDELRRWMVVADNDAEIFAGTVREVVSGRCDPDDDAIHAALHAAVAEDIVDALPGGLDAEIAAGGSDLSGGQRQRIRLARALYADPDVLLAVEPTSAVDATTEAAMVERISAARVRRTTVLTTTSPLVLDRADEVVVLVDGKVSAVGTHADLLRTDACYRELVSRAQNAAADA